MPLPNPNCTLQIAVDNSGPQPEVMSESNVRSDAKSYARHDVKSNTRIYDR